MTEKACFATAAERHERPQGQQKKSRIPALNVWKTEPDCHPQSESQVLGKHPRTAWTLTTRKKVESDTEEVLLHFKLACWAVYINKAMQTKASHCYLDVKNDF